MTPDEAKRIFNTVLETTDEPLVREAMAYAVEAMENKEPTAKWAPIVEENGKPYWEENYEPMFLCTRCECKSYKKPFCPHCGARITEADV